MGDSGVQHLISSYMTDYVLKEGKGGCLCLSHSVDSLHCYTFQLLTTLEQNFSNLTTKMPLMVEDSELLTLSPKRL